MTTHLPSIYKPWLNRLRAELVILDRALALAHLLAEERDTCTKHLATCRAALAELEKAINLTHDYYREACEDRDATHAELRDALTRLRELTAATTPRRLPAVFIILAAAALGALITTLSLLILTA